MSSLLPSDVDGKYKAYNDKAYTVLLLYSTLWLSGMKNF